MRIVKNSIIAEIWRLNNILKIKNPCGQIHQLQGFF